MIQVTISNEKEHHEAWPSITTTRDGSLIVVYKESDGHLNLQYSRIVARISSDGGFTWSDRIEVCSFSSPDKEGLTGSGRIARLDDGSLLIAVDRFFIDSSLKGKPYLFKYMNGDTLLYRSFNNGITWQGPDIKPINGSLCSLKQMKSGAILLGATHFSYNKNPNMNQQIQVVYRSSDRGCTWEGPVTVLSCDDFQPSEGDFVELDNGIIVCYMRDEDFLIELPNRASGLKCFSYDQGMSWDGPYSSGRWLYNGMISAGLLKTGDIMVTSRLGMGKQNPYFGYFPAEPRRKPEFIGYWRGQESPYLYAYVESQEDAMKKIPAGAGYDSPLPASGRWMLIDNDKNTYPDYGYSSWVTLPSGDAFVTQFITDDAPVGKPQIRGYIVKVDELLNPCRDYAFTFGLTDYKTGPLEGQDDWVYHSGGKEPTVVVDAAQGVVKGIVSETLNENISIDSTWMAPSVKTENSEAQTLRRDIGPFNLYDEAVMIEFDHRGLSEHASILLYDDCRQVVLELNFSKNEKKISAVVPLTGIKDEISIRNEISINKNEISINKVENKWYSTKIEIAVERIKVYTKRKNAPDDCKAWCNEKVSDFIILSGIGLKIGGEGSFTVSNIKVEKVKQI